MPNPNVDNDPELPRFMANKVEIVHSDVVGLNNVIDLSKYSSLNKAVRTLQCFRKCLNVLKSKLFQKDAEKFSHFSSTKYLSVAYSDCKIDLLRMDQSIEFQELIKYFEGKRKVKSKIPQLVNQLNVILDASDSLLKVKSKMSKLFMG